MPELRRDPTSNRWVIIATERAARPTDFASQGASDLNDQEKCPFCEGREDRTPPEITALRHGTAPNTPGWEVRVVPNKYPALGIEGTTAVHNDSLFEWMDGVGAHEVIVETPLHHAHPATLPVGQVAKVIAMYRARYLDLDRDERFRYLLLFRNHGRSAGASLSHPHSQLIALPIVPRTAVEELHTARDHFAARGRCVYCDLLEQEQRRGERLVTANEHFVAFEPFASRFPFETWIVPRRHTASFGEIADHEIPACAAILKETLGRLAATLDNPAYNYMVHTSPYDDPAASHSYHWHVEIIPRLTQVAGFEWGTGFYINPVVPERAAVFLREAPPPPDLDPRPREAVPLHGEVGS